MSKAERARIGIDVSAAVTQGGGIGRYTRELVRAVVARDPQFKYQLFSVKPPEQLPVPSPVPSGAHVTYRALPLTGRWMYRLWYRLRLPLSIQLATGPIDLFHSPDFVLPPVAGNIPTLLTVHDLSFIHYPNAYTPALVNYLNRVVPWSVERATHILADSEATRLDLERLWHVDASRITVLYSGVDQTFKPVSEDVELRRVQRKYGLEAAPYVLAVGTVQPRKNYQMLIRAFRAVADQFPHQLAIAGGKGWLFDEMMAEVTRQGLDDRVRFIGFVDDDDLPTLYSGSTLFVQPSLYEGFGIPVLEAMACGVPTVVSDSSSLPEVAGDASCLLPATDEAAWSKAICQLLADEPERQRLREAGLIQKEKFSWQTAAQQLEAVYSRLLST